MEFLKSYVFLLQIRFGDNLQVQWPEALPESKQVLPLSLQMLVENAVKHNVVSSEEPLKISLVIEGDYLAVSNNLQRRNSVEHSTQKGLQNIRSRYEHLCDQKVKVEETSALFTVKIPLC
jgi:two-component system, LytTR family, sensor kinase